MAYNSNFRSSEITGANPVTITNEAQVVVDLSYKSAGSRGVLLSEAPLKESPSTIVMTVGGTTFTEVDISAFTGAANTFAVEYASNSGVILLPPGTATGTATTTTYKGLGSVATIESKRYNPDGLVTAPSVSFENDPDTGLYLIGANNMGFVAGGVQTSQLNSLGVLNGTITGASADGKNLINRTYGALRRNVSPTLNATTNSSTWTSSEIGIAYTPLLNNSYIKIQFNLSVAMSTISVNANVDTSLIRLYRDSSEIPNMLSNIPATSTLISNGHYRTAFGFNNGTINYQNQSNFNMVFIDKPNTTSIRYYYLGFSSGSGLHQTILYSASATEASFYIIEEYI